MDAPEKLKLTSGQKRRFYSKLIKLGVPLAIQQFVTSLINLLDTFMLGSVSEDVLTAAGLANKLFFVLIVVIYGVSSGASIFMARFFGQKDLNSVKRYLGISLTAAFVLGSAFTLAAILFPEAVMRIFSSSPAVIAYGASYLRIVGFSYIFTSISACIYAALKSAKHAYIPLVFTLVSLAVNFAFNMLLIFGLSLGIEGAAYATLIARVTELAALLITLKIRKTAISGKLKEFFSFSRGELKSFALVAGFVVFVETEWSVGNALYGTAFKNFGTAFQAAVQVTDTCVMMFNVLAIALGTAAAVAIGHAIGEGKKQTAVLYAKKLWLLAIIFGAVMGAGACALSGVIPLMFPKLSAEGARNTSVCLLIMGAVMPVRCLEFMLMVGIIRSGGDTRFAAVCDIAAVWVLTLPVMLIATYVFNAPFALVYVLSNLEMLFKCVAGSVRLFKNDGWLHEFSSAQTQIPPAESGE
jgi:putative MATE family efflux protein